MPAPRPYWRGHLRISLVSFAVQLHTAVEGSARLSLHKIHEPTGERVRYQDVVPGHGPVDKEDIVKGYEYERGRYVTIDPQDLEDIQIESRKTIDVVQFVDAGAIEGLYYEKPYFLSPDGEAAEEAFVVVREALRRTRKVGLGQVVLSGRERLVAVRPCGRGMWLETLRYAEEVREADRFFGDIPDIKPPKDQLDMAKDLIEKKSAPFAPEEFQDRYKQALDDLVQAKLKDKAPKGKRGAKRKGGEVIDLGEALKKSLGAEDKAANSRKKRKSA